MFNLTKKYWLITVTLFIFSFFLISTVLAGPAEIVEGGFANTGKAAGFNISDDDVTPEREFVEAWATYASGFAGVLSAVAVLLLIYSGWLWMSAMGNEEQVGNAKKIILGAIIGLTIIISARIIAELIITYLARGIGIQ